MMERYSIALEEALDFTHDWYRDVPMRSLDNRRFQEMLVTHWVLADTISDPIRMSVRIASFPGIAMTDGTTLFLSPTVLHSELYKSFGIQNHDYPTAALLLINGLQIHEAGHCKYTPECKVKEACELTVKGQAAYKRAPNLMGTIFNVIEDLHIEQRLQNDFSHLAPFVYGTREMICDWKGCLEQIQKAIAKADGKWNPDAMVSVLIAATNQFNWPMLEDEDFTVTYEAEVFTEDKEGVRFVKEPTELALPSALLLALSKLREAIHLDIKFPARVDLAAEITEMLLEEAQANGTSEDENKEDGNEDTRDRSGGNGIFVYDPDGKLSDRVDDAKSLMDGILGGSIDPETVVIIGKSEFDSKEARELLVDLQDAIEASRDPHRRKPELSKMSGRGAVRVNFHTVKPETDKERPRIGVKYEHFAQNLRRMREIKHTYGMPNDHGRIVGARLHRIITDGLIMALPDVEKRVRQPPQVIILIDWSGSMRFNSRSQSTLKETAGLVNALINARIPVAVYAHTGDSEGHADVIGVCAMDMKLGKGQLRHHTDWSLRLFSLTTFQLRQNYDGHAIDYVSKCFQDNGKPKMLIVISDGIPEAGPIYRGDAAVAHTRDTVHGLRRHGIRVVSLSIDEDVMEDNNTIYGEKWNMNASTPRAFTKSMQTIGEAIASDSI